MKIPVAGIGCTQFGELWNKSLADLLAQSQYAALKDAHMTAKDIEMVFVGNMCAECFSGQGNLGVVATDILGISVPAFRIEAACASGGVALAAGVMAILSGRARVVMVSGVEKMTDVDNGTITSGLMSAALHDIEYFSGASIPGLFALIARCYMSEYRIGKDVLAAVSVKNHNNALLNSCAHLKKKITIDDVLNASMIADPLGLLDCSPVSDGAASIILCSPDVSQKTNEKKVSIIASAQATDSLLLGRRSSYTSFKATRDASLRAYLMAGITVDDIDFAEVHDAFSMAEIIALEDLGFYKPGTAGHATIAGDTALSGALPVNVSGGLKAKGHPIGATGISQAVEIIMQLRQSAGLRQIKNARRGLSHNMGGIGTSAVVHIFECEGFE